MSGLSVEFGRMEGVLSTRCVYVFLSAPHEGTPHIGEKMAESGASGTGGSCCGKKTMMEQVAKHAQWP
jgi:hypothetical protein